MSEKLPPGSQTDAESAQDALRDNPVALEVGPHFAVREAGKTIGSGVIAEVLNEPVGVERRFAPTLFLHLPERR